MKSQITQFIFALIFGTLTATSAFAAIPSDQSIEANISDAARFVDGSISEDPSWTAATHSDDSTGARDIAQDRADDDIVLLD